MTTKTPDDSKIDKPQIATVTRATQISTVTPSGGHATVPLDPGTQLTVLSINADGTITAVTNFHFQGQVPQTCVSINKP